MIGLALSSLIGILATMLISRAFGTQPELDAFNAANRLTEILFSLMAGGALASAFIPTLATFLAREDDSGAWRLAASIANIVLLLMTAVAAVIWLAAPWLVPHVLAPGFTDAAQIAMTVGLLRIMLLTSIIFGLSGLLMGVLNAYQRFALPALAPASYRLGQILGLLVLVPRWGIYGLAWGAVLGSALHFLIQIPGLRGLGARYAWQLNLKDPAVRQVGRLMGPRVLGVAVVQINFLVNIILASAQPVGSVSALNYAFTIMTTALLLIGQAPGIAVMPTFSSQLARGQSDEFRSTLARALSGVFFLALPGSLGLILLRGPIVRVLLERGAFDAHSAELVAWALLWFAAGLVGHSLLEIVARGFYAHQDTRTPVIVGAAAMSLNVVLSLALAALFGRLGWFPHGGLALANSLATALEVSILLLLIRRRLGGLGLGALSRGIGATIAASMVMGVALWGWLAFTADRSAWLIGLGGVLIGGGIYWLVARLLGSAEAREIPRLLLRQRG
jgi:putative peptidoglycan lipid II flippase